MMTTTATETLFGDTFIFTPSYWRDKLVWSSLGVTNTRTVAGPNKTSDLFSTGCSFMFCFLFFFTCFQSPKKTFLSRCPL